MRKFEVVKNCPFSVKLPERSTSGSAVYDFYSAYPFVIAPGQTLMEIIAFAFTNHGSEPLEVKVGDKIGQGIFLPFLLTDDDEASGDRTGGIGITGD